MSEALAPKRIDAGSVSLERLSSDRIDLHDWYAFWCDCDPVVFDHLDLVPNQTLKTVANRVAALEDAWADAESFSYVVRRDDTLAGYADLQADWDRRAAEVGVVLDRPYWGEDIASDVVARSPPSGSTGSTSTSSGSPSTRATTGRSRPRRATSTGSVATSTVRSVHSEAGTASQ